jgi:hypothetical protein
MGQAQQFDHLRKKNLGISAGDIGRTMHFSLFIFGPLAILESNLSWALGLIEAVFIFGLWPFYQSSYLLFIICFFNID